jgi:putative ABC transport system permease protein
MGRVIFRGFLSRKLRSALTAIAVVLGVAMISGTFVLTDKIEAAFTNIVQEGNRNVDVSITKASAFGASTPGEAGVPFAASTAAEVARIDGVREAAAVVETSGFLVRGSEKLTAEGGAPSILGSVEPPALSAYVPVAGALPERSGEVAVNEKLAEDEGLRVGQRLQLSTATGLHPVRIAGVVKFGDVSSVGGATIVLAPLPDVQRWAHLDGLATRVTVAGEDGVSETALAERIRASVPADLTVETGTVNADRQAGDIADQLGFLKYLLLAFGFVAVFVGAVIIFNTYSITVAQRTREFGVLRTLGASGRQTLLAVLGEALLVGTIGTGVGILGGVGFGSLMTWIFDRAGFGIPSVGTIVEARTIVWAVLVGVGVTLAAALLPALRAKGVSPLAALGAGVSPRRGRHRLRVSAAALGLALSIALIGLGVAGGSTLETRLATLGGGALTFFVAVALAMPYLVRPVVATLAPLIHRLGGEGKLATGNTTRNPGRTGVTAAALMVGTGLVVFVAILGSGLKASISDSLDRSVHGDLVVQAETYGAPLPAGAVAATAAVPGVGVTSPVGVAPVQIDGKTQAIAAGVDVDTFGAVYGFDWDQGSDELAARLGTTGALLERGIANAAGVGVGERIAVRNRVGEVRSFEVRGTYDDPNVLNAVLVSKAGLAPLLEPGNTGVGLILVKAAASADAAAVQRGVERALTQFPVASVQSNAELKAQVESDVNQLLAIFYALLAMSVVISLFGIVNTLVLSVYERTREIGLLRAIGTTHRQVRRMIRYESVLTAVLGALVGVGVGVVFGYAVTTALSGEGLAFALPAGQIAVFMVLAVVAGVLAAVFPARRASRLDVLRALQHE